jgi:asparagine synthase (glutamine-hydrolysing)
MCGICGIVNFNGRAAEEAAVRKMMAAMKHRGPDGEGVFTAGNIALGHVRLSIIDLSSEAGQPMTSSCGRYVIVFNGEIYNYRELKQELRNNYAFRTDSDTEVLIAAYARWGKDCLRKINGMFAFAVYDTTLKTLFIARDRFGIKPLYLCHKGDSLYFASDIPPLLSISRDAEADYQAVYDFLLYNRTNYSDRTFFRGIHRLLPGRYMEIGGAMHTKRWYVPGDEKAEPFSCPEEYLEQLRNAVRLQLRSDVPLGVCLSGGLDSSSITSLTIAEEGYEDVHSFSAVYGEGLRGDESSFINEYNGILKNMHFTRPSANELAEELETFVRQMVEPLPGTSEYAEYSVMKLSSQHVTVLLNGQGADETMAGYLYFAGYYYKELFRKLRWGKMLSEMIHDVSLHKSFKGPAAFLFFSSPAGIKALLAGNNSSWLHRDFASQHHSSDEITRKLYASPGLNASFRHHLEHKFEHHLIWADRSGMAFSLEARFPFLDHDLVERTLALPPEMLIRKGWNKFILREAMKGILPERIRIRRDKVGYENPQSAWMRSEGMQKIIKEVISSDSFRQRKIVDAGSAEKMAVHHAAGKADYSTQLWKIIHLELWFRNFMDN